MPDTIKRVLFLLIYALESQIILKNSQNIGIQEKTKRSVIHR